MEAGASHDPDRSSVSRAQPAAPAPPDWWVDPAEVRLARTPPWADPRWLERVQSLLGEEPPFALLSAAPALERLRAVLDGLSFVEHVERLEVTPDGLELELMLRKPIACIPVAGEFALVAEDGVVLEGRWPLPPRLGRAYLPVLGPLHDPLFARAQAGDWLAEQEHADAIDVARSLAMELVEDERAALGRLVIDARTARRSSLGEPGVRLGLEGGRLALFGRAPRTDEPGELDATRKWRSLVRAFDWFAADPLANDWRLVDLRWDRPDLEPVAWPETAALDLARPMRAEGLGDARRRDRAGPRVQ
jgi:hypothetical protein